MTNFSFEMESGDRQESGCLSCLQDGRMLFVHGTVPEALVQWFYALILIQPHLPGPSFTMRPWRDTLFSLTPVFGFGFRKNEGIVQSLTGC